MFYFQRKIQYYNKNIFKDIYCVKAHTFLSLLNISDIISKFVF